MGTFDNIQNKDNGSGSTLEDNQSQECSAIETNDAFNQAAMIIRVPKERKRANNERKVSVDQINSTQVKRRDDSSKSDQIAST